MLINRGELARKVLEGESTSLDDLNSVLRSLIKDVVETAMGAEMTGFLSASLTRASVTSSSSDSLGL
ncbi:hypothetical protein [Solidesulfovibrio alcoholivorans]|uniref:hypothetical protein n=1 Tax=Solidesulfovibrio alcoholivorans TaxID=81406 RepID=UPI00049500E2|nr:hypothetical protein [Solidesulfovibrio alcoholivorans]